jgi:hypothetical protein
MKDEYNNDEIKQKEEEEAFLVYFILLNQKS